MSLSFYFSRTGAVICQNHKGLIFFLPGEPFNSVKAARPIPRSIPPHTGNRTITIVSGDTGIR